MKSCSNLCKESRLAYSDDNPVDEIGAEKIGKVYLSVSVCSSQPDLGFRKIGISNE